MTAQTTHHVEIDAGVALVTLARPDVRNAFNAAMIAELTATFTTLGADPELCAVVLLGEGKTFCAGADVGWMREAATRDAVGNRVDAQKLADMFSALAAIPCLTVSAVTGAALGGGAGLAAATDLCIAEDGCKFGFTEVRLGIIPAVISAFVVPAIGERAARGLFASGSIFDAQFAKSIGLVTEVVPEGMAKERAMSFARDARGVAPLASRRAKRLPAEVRRRSGSDLLGWLANEIAEVRGLPEAREGLAAFIEKRSPAWDRRTS